MKKYAPSSLRQKAILLMLLAAIAVTATVQWAGWKVFGGFEKEAAALAWLAAGLYTIRLLHVLEQP